MYVMTIVEFLDHYPGTAEERMELVQANVDQLAAQWRDAGLPRVPTFHVLVHPPAATIGNSMQGLSNVDQVEAQAKELGLVPVAVTLADTVEIAGQYEVAQILPMWD